MILIAASPVIVIILTLVLRFGYDNKNAWLIPAIYYVLVHFLRWGFGFWDLFLEEVSARAFDYGFLALSLGYLVYKTLPFVRETWIKIYK